MPPVARTRAWWALVGHRRWPLAVLAVSVLTAAVAPVLAEARAARSADESVATAVAGLDAAQRGVRVTTNSADDAAAQQAAATTALAGVLGNVEVVGARLTYPLDAHEPDDPSAPTRSVILAHVADWADRVDVVDGRAPQPGDAVEVVAPAAAGIATGTRLLVGSAGLPVEVVGTWQPRDPGDPLWFADPGLADGTMSDRRGATGPLFVADDAAVDRAAERPLVRWTVAPPVAALAADDLARLARGLAAAPDALAAAGVVVQGSTVEADGGPTLAAIADRAVAAEHRARTAVVAALGAGVLGLLAAAATLERATRRERERLLSRGAARTRLVRRESAGVALAALAGGLLGRAAAPLVGAGHSALATAAWAAAFGAVAALGTWLRRLPVDVGRGRSALRAALAALLVVLTGLAVWRLTTTSDAPDVVAQAAPLLALTCAGLLVGLVVRRVGPGPVGVQRAWLLPAVAALLGGSAGYALRSDDPTLRAAWLAAGVGAVAIGVVTAVADLVARPAVTPARGRDAVVRVVGLVVACGVGVGVALATAGLVVGGAS